MAQAVANFIHKYSIHFNTLYHIPLELRCLYVCIYQKSLNIPMLGRYSSFSTFSSGMHNTKTHFFLDTEMRCQEDTDPCCFEATALRRANDPSELEEGRLRLAKL